MSEHAARIAWSRGSAAFDYETFSRDHTWTFPDGVTVNASSAPAFLGADAAVDPEEAFVAAVSACHMLTFLAIASRKRIAVDGYEDDAVGVLEKNAEGRLAVTRITLRPRVTFADPAAVSAEELGKLHDSAHRNCFIANSIRSEVTLEARGQDAPGL
jgi:organic hydroperoxide reductase OsmC/OhrA